jgi:hypothetical protein
MNGLRDSASTCTIETET